VKRIPLNILYMIRYHARLYPDINLLDIIPEYPEWGKNKNTTYATKINDAIYLLIYFETRPIKEKLKCSKMIPYVAEGHVQPGIWRNGDPPFIALCSVKEGERVLSYWAESEWEKYKFYVLEPIWIRTNASNAILQKVMRTLEEILMEKIL